MQPQRRIARRQSPVVSSDYSPKEQVNRLLAAKVKTDELTGGRMEKDSVTGN
jgi:hypothetical protein